MCPEVADEANLGEEASPTGVTGRVEVIINNKVKNK